MNLSRRLFFKKAIGTTATALVATHSIQTLAEVCSGEPTDSQTMGPFFPRPNTPIKPVVEDNTPGLPLHLANDNDLTFVKDKDGKAKGQIVYIEGKILDQKCNPIPNATVVIWQASETGQYNHLGDDQNQSFPHPETGLKVDRILDPNFQYWGKAKTDAQGNYRFKTIVPGFYPADLNSGWYRPPHIHYMVTALGFQQLVTQMYFKGKDLMGAELTEKLNKKDLILQSPNHTESERNALIVEFKKDPSGMLQDGLIGKFDLILKR